MEILFFRPLPVFRKGPVGIPRGVLADSGRNPATFSGLFLETASLPEVPRHFGAHGLRLQEKYRHRSAANHKTRACVL